MEWYKLADIVARESEVTSQKTDSLLDHLEQQQRLFREQQVKTRQDIKAYKSRMFTQNLIAHQRRSAADEIGDANRQLTQLGVKWSDLLPVNESSIKQQIMSGRVWADNWVKEVETATEEDRTEALTKEAEEWAKHKIRQAQNAAKERGETAPSWADLSPDMKDSLTQTEYDRLTAQPTITDVPVEMEERPSAAKAKLHQIGTTVAAWLAEKFGDEEQAAKWRESSEYWATAAHPDISQGVEIQDGVYMMPDFSVVANNQTIGSIDPQTGDFIEKEPAWWEKMGNIVNWLPTSIPTTLIRKYGFAAIEKVDLPFMIQNQAQELDKKGNLTAEETAFMDLYKQEVGEPPTDDLLLKIIHQPINIIRKWAGADLSPSEELKKAYYDSAGVGSRILHGIETPLTVALFTLGGLGGATAQQAKLAKIAEQGGKAGKAAQVGQMAVAPLVGYEWAIGNVIAKTVGGTYRVVMTSVLRRNLHSWAKSAGVQIPKATEDAFIREALRTLRPSFMTKEALRTLFNPTKGGHTVTQAGAKAAEEAAEQTVRSSPLLLGLTKPTTPTAGAVTKGVLGATSSVAPKSTGVMGIVPGQVTQSSQPLVKYWLKNGWTVSKPTTIVQMRQLEGMGFEPSPNLKGYFVKRPEGAVPETTVTETPETTALAEGETVSAAMPETMGMVDWDTYAMAGGDISGEVPEGVVAAEQQSMVEAAQGRLLIDDEGVPTSSFNRLVQNVIGKKEISEMTVEEVKLLEDVIVRLPLGRGGKPPKIPSAATIYDAILPMSKEFVEKIPVLKDLGFIDRFRPARKVWGKLDMYHEIYEPTFNTEILMNEARTAFQKELTEVAKLVPRNRRAVLFDALENPEVVLELTPNEEQARLWFKEFFDDWADRLEIPASKRRDNYVTHIFEADIANQLKQGYLDTELYQSLDFITPKKVFMPFLEKRLGRTAGVVRDPFKAASAYQARALKKYYYEPLIKRIRIYERYLPTTAQRHLREYINRLTGRPLEADMAINNDLKNIANVVAKLPKGKGLANILSSGNAAGMLAYYATGAYYMAWLGARPASAIKNLSQHGLTLSEVGPVHLANGIGLRFTREGKEVLKESKVVRSRGIGYLPGIDKAFITHWPADMQEKAMTLFRGADSQNVKDAFLAGYSEAKSAGLPREWAIKRGDEVAEITQYIYTKMGGAMWTQTAPGRMLGVMTTWPVNFVEVASQWVRGTPSRVFTDYARETGKPPPPQDKPIFNKKLMTFLLLSGALYATQKNSKIRAMMYTGAMSLQAMADILSGDLPGLTWPGGIANIVAGTFTGDADKIKQGWRDINPTETIAIFRQMIDIARGERDWMSLFLYENYEYVRKNRSASQSAAKNTQQKNTIRDIMAQSEYGKKWKDLSVVEKSQLVDEYPELE